MPHQVPGGRAQPGGKWELTNCPKRADQLSALTRNFLPGTFMLAQFGFGVFVLTFLLSLFSLIAAMSGYFSGSERWVDAARRSMLLTFPIITLGTLSLVILLVTGHYELEYVYSVTSNDMPLYLKITALWGGQAGSLVLWSWLMSAFASAVTLRNWERDRELLPWVIVVISFTQSFFLALTIFFENPFTRWWQTLGGDFIL